jgi:23S rRNA pseudouridine2605 synthase
MEKGERIAKVIAHAGLCSRRDAERWIAEGRVEIDGVRITTPAITVTDASIIRVDGKPLPTVEKTRLWLYHKPKGLITTHYDPQGRATVFDHLPPALPRVISVGRLDLNTEGLLLLTNDGALARTLELPSTGWVRTYRARVFGTLDFALLEKSVKNGITIDGMHYAPAKLTLGSQQGRNSWIDMEITEGKNREVRRIFEHFGLSVNRLIRTSYGPFQLGTLALEAVKEVPPPVIN